jgi:hypothetical protein
MLLNRSGFVAYSVIGDPRRCPAGKVNVVKGEPRQNRTSPFHAVSRL